MSSSAILGISAYYHDSAAVLLINGEIIAAAQEERFTRKKHDSSFPLNAVRYVLSEGKITIGDLDAIAFYDKPYIKFERLLETYHAFAPFGLLSFLSAMPVWIKEKIFMRRLIHNKLKILGSKIPEVYFPEHHLSHAASAFYPSPFKKAAILTVDGVGEWATATIGKGNEKDITVIYELHFPHSVGLLYSAFTYYCGFKINNGEYKLMGLAPYGNPESNDTLKFKRIILEKLVDIREDGSILLNMKYFSFATGLRMCRDSLWEKLFSLPRRKPESPVTQEYMNLAMAIQQVTEEIVYKMAKTAKEVTGCDNLVMAGGVALNCVVNGKIAKSGLFNDIWIQPAAGDAGGALGAAYTVWHIGLKKERKINGQDDVMKGAYLGPDFSPLEITNIAQKYSAPYIYYENFDKLVIKISDLLSEGKVIGWFQGRMEFGPRALGNRSILGDARNPEMQKKLNLKIKYRESFRPFAPSVIEEDIKEYFELEKISPYMLLVVPLKKSRRNPLPSKYNTMTMYEKLYFVRSDIPAVTHIDYSARVQSVGKNKNERYWKLLNAFKKKTGYSLLVNTSFNIRGEPIVCTPDDAYKCFMKTEMDCLVMGDYLFLKSNE